MLKSIIMSLFRAGIRTNIHIYLVDFFIQFTIKYTPWIFVGFTESILIYLKYFFISSQHFLLTLAERKIH